MTLSSIRFPLLLALAFITAGCQLNSDSQSIDQPYLGQTPPGLTPEVFAPGLVSTQDWEGDINTPQDNSFGSVTPDGKFFFFHTHLGEGKANIYWVDAAVIAALRTK